MIINDKVYGKQIVDDPIILEIINSRELQRLKKIGQYSTYNLVPEFNVHTTRFDHSLGVYFLLRKLGASITEQIAGLIHDINHTAFSHVIDYVFGQETTQEYGDNKHIEIFENSEIKQILLKHNININKVLDKKSLALLDNEIPNLCADRLDYILRDALSFRRISKSDVEMVVEQIIVKDNTIVIRTKKAAEFLARIFLDMSAQIYASPYQSGSFRLLANAVKIALDQKFIIESDLMKTDDELLTILSKIDNSEIKKNLKCINPGHIITHKNATSNSFYVKTKFRFVNPSYYEDDHLVRVFDQNIELKKYKDKLKKVITRGYHLEIIE